MQVAYNLCFTADHTLLTPSPLVEKLRREVVPLVDKSKLLGGCAASEPAGSTPSFCFKILPRDQLEVHPL